MPDALITPPYRAPLLSGTDTARDWWLFWDRLSTQTNSNAKLAVQGLHDDRPDPEGMPDGAIYVESDRGVIYQNQDGVWVYLAGTMYGTLAPDLRPVDLDEFDSGLRYVATDSDRAARGREFVWVDTTWIEITPVLYGTHATRPAAAAAPARALYAETDRSSVLYQSQAGGTWEFVAGTMWGTLVPDQRPTGLGTHDAGFTFRTSVPPARSFVWSGTAWVETTPVVGDVQHANATANLTLTPTPTLIPGASLVLNLAGRYLITGNFSFAVINDFSIGFRGDLVANGAGQTGVIITATSSIYCTASQQWLFQATATGQTVYLRASKDSGAGTSLAMAPYTTITAQWISP